MKEISLYIHIPFCVSKCYYCDFSSFVNKNDKIDIYIDSLIKELSLYKHELNQYYIKTIFIGGGTPSSIASKYIYRILEFINKNYNISRLNEVTIEANPGTLDKEKIKIYKAAGINRVSMGAQTLDDNLLKIIGRTHKVEDIYQSFELLRNANINNINIDLMFGLPSQSIEDVMDSLKKVVDLKIEHISYYGLILEEGTYLNKLFKEGKVILPSEDKERIMYHKATEYLIQNGYNHYEISNYSLSEYECKHNLVYWNVLPYLGLGLSSHSNLNNKRFWNISDINLYISNLNNNKIPIEGEEIISKEIEIAEFCILGLRKISGINKVDFKNRFNIEIEELYKEIIQKHEKNKLIVNNSNSIQLTKKGLDLSNLVEVDFLK
jgi:oxygen-independent coproporphyrinogen-3 oxidase